MATTEDEAEKKPEKPRRGRAGKAGKEGKAANAGKVGKAPDAGRASDASDAMPTTAAAEDAAARDKGELRRSLLTRWGAIWGGRPPSLFVVLLALVVAAFMSGPLVYVLVRALAGGTDVWVRLFGGRLPELFFNTITLTVTVTVLATILGVTLARLVERTDLPGRSWLRWLLAMPLAIPPYVGGLAYITIFGPRGAVELQIEAFFGRATADLMPSIFGFFGSALILTLFTYPYVYLLVGAAFRSVNSTLEDAARTLGCNDKQAFRQVTLPLLRPAVGAGALLVALYVLSDFGAVALMRFDTFTLAIYQELTARFSREAAAALSAVLVAITFIVLWAETRIQGKAKFYQTVGTWRPPRPAALEAKMVPAVIYVWLMAFFALILPVGLLGYWSYQAFAGGEIDGALLGFTLNSFGISAVAATIAVAIGLPLAFLAARHPGLLSRTLSRLAQTGYALPGVVVALSLVFIYARFLPGLYGTVIVLVSAYIARFMPQALRGTASGLGQISPNIEDAARSLGRSQFRTMIEVTIPLILPSLLAGWTLVFLSTLKELPATLILRPIGFDTLPVRLWAEASEGFYSLASVPALILVAVSVVPLYLLLTRAGGGLSDAR